MKQYIAIAFASILFAACSQSPINKANAIIANSATYKSIGEVERIDSIFGYKDAYGLLNMGRVELWKEDSILSAHHHKISSQLEDMILFRAGNANKLKKAATDLYVVHELAGHRKEFLGFCATKKISSRITYIVCFDKELTKIEGVEVVIK